MIAKLPRIKQTEKAEANFLFLSNDVETVTIKEILESFFLKHRHHFCPDNNEQMV